MKKVISVLMAAVMILCLASCGTQYSGNAEHNNTASNSNTNTWGSRGSGGYALSSLKFPATVSNPDYDFEKYNKNGNFDNDSYMKELEKWQEYSSEKEALKDLYIGKLNDYFRKASVFLDAEKGANAVCSPVNIFFALAMLAEIAGGNTRAEILDALGVKTIEELRDMAKALWEYHYTDDSILKVLLGSSVWLNTDHKELEFNMNTIAVLAEYYYATAYEGSSSDPGFTAEFKKWLNDQTGGLLKAQIDELEGLDDPNLVMAIATTIYFKGSWAEEFNEAATTSDDFTGPNGKIQVPFMHKTDRMQYYMGNGFSAVELPFNGADRMWIILPDENNSPEKLNADGTIADFLEQISKDDADNLRAGSVKLSLPKFDVDAKTDLIPMLKELGIKDAFTENADFSNITQSTDLSVSSALHAARVKIDEEGCEAAAFTVLTLENSALFIEDPLEFNVNRPFAFVITGNDGLPLFTGIVNDPR